jgi:tetratricopeptide (TPR) repeat protein
MFGNLAQYCAKSGEELLQMSAEEDAQRVMRTYRMRQRKRGPLAEAGRRLGMRAKIVADWNRNKRGMRAMDLLQTQEAMEIRLPAELFHEALFTLDTDPAGVLEYAREFQNLPMDPFLASIKPRLEALAAVGPSNDAAPWPSREEEIRRLDLLRRRDRGLAKRQLQLLITTELGLLEQGPRPRRAFAELCGELGVLAAIYRLAGRRDDTVDLLVLVRPLVVLAADFRVEAHWYQRSAYLLVELGRYPRADEFILRAQDLFAVVPSKSDQLRTLVDRAYVLTRAGKHEASLARLKVVIPLLPAADIENRLAAHQIFADNLRFLGDVEGACNQLDHAIKLVGDDLLARAACLWSRAKLLVDLKQIPKALATFAEALPLQARVRSAGELAELAMEYASLLKKEGCRPELRQLAADLAGWIEALRGNSRLRDAVDDFQALIEFDQLDEVRFRQLLDRLQAEKLERLRHQKKPSRSQKA